MNMYEYTEKIKAQVLDAEARTIGPNGLCELLLLLPLCFLLISK